MTKLNLNEYGVQEMNNEEMKKVDGGANSNWPAFGKNDVGKPGGFYLINFLWIPIGIGFSWN